MQLALFFHQCSFSRRSDWITNDGWWSPEYTVQDVWEWLDQELFFYWLKDLFLKHIPPVCPVMLVMDGHSSYYTLKALHGAAQEGVIVFCILPNTTHATQPLDVSLFGALKRHWSSVCHPYLTNNYKSERGHQSWESSSNEHTVCFGSYDGDLDSDGALLHEWVQCTNNECQKWMHKDCVEQEDSCLKCAVCNTEFQWHMYKRVHCS